MMNLSKLEMDISRRFLESERLLHIVHQFWLIVNLQIHNDIWYEIFDFI